MNELFENVTSCEEFQEVVVENKKTFWGERIGNSSFGGAGQKAILLNTPNGKEFVSYEQAFNGKGKFGKILNSFFFGASEEDKMSVTDILTLIDENLSDEDIGVLVDSLVIANNPTKLTLDDVFSNYHSSESQNIQEYFNDAYDEHKDVLNGEWGEVAKSSVMGVAICNYYNKEFDFLKYDFEVNSDDVHITWTSKGDSPFLRRLASQDYYLFRSAEVDAFARLGDRKLSIILLR